MKNYMSNGELIIKFVWWKRYCYIKISYFSPYVHNKNKIELELDLSNYARNSELKNSIGVDVWQFA